MELAAIVLIPPTSSLPGALALLGTGGLLLRYGLRNARRHGLLTAVYWQTFWQFAPYRAKRLLSLGLVVAGGILLIWGAVMLYGWLGSYYAARLGHPLP